MSSRKVTAKNSSLRKGEIGPSTEGYKNKTLNMTRKEEPIDGYYASLELDFAYQNYLEALMKQYDQQQALKKKEQAIEMYLINRLKEDEKIQDELLYLEETIEETKLKFKLTELKNKVTTFIDEAEKLLTPDILKQFQKIVGCLHDDMQNLYLKNINAVRSSEEIAKFKQLLTDCKNLLVNIQQAGPSKQVLQIQVKTLKEFKDFEKNYLTLAKDVEKLDEQVTSLTLKTISDKLTDYIQ